MSSRCQCCPSYYDWHCRSSTFHIRNDSRADVSASRRLTGSRPALLLRLTGYHYERLLVHLLYCIRATCPGVRLSVFVILHFSRVFQANVWIYQLFYCVCEVFFLYILRQYRIRFRSQTGKWKKCLKAQIWNKISLHSLLIEVIFYWHEHNPPGSRRRVQNRIEHS